LHVANPLIDDPEIILPEGIAGVGFRQRLYNSETAGIGFQRTIEIAAPLLDITEESMCPIFVDCMIASPRQL
jgi:hypothetical protein